MGLKIVAKKFQSLVLFEEVKHIVTGLRVIGLRGCQATLEFLSQINGFNQFTQVELRSLKSKVKFILFNFIAVNCLN